MNLNFIQSLFLAILIFSFIDLKSQYDVPLDTFKTQLQAILDNATGNYGMEGAELSVIFSDNEQVETFQSGIRAPGVQVDPTKPWHYAGATAGYTNYIILRMAEEGKLDLDKQISDYMDAASMGLDGSIKLRQLLNHTSILNEMWVAGSNPSACYQDIWNTNPTVLGCPSDFLKCMPADKTTPGNYDRNNSNLYVLEYLIDSIAGHSYETEFKNRIFDLFSMKGAYMSSCKTVTIDSINGIWTTASGYANNQSYLRYFSTSGANRGLISSSDHVARFYRALFKDRLLSSTHMNLLKTPISGSQIPIGQLSCASHVWAEAGYNTDIIGIVNSSGDTARLYGKGGFGMNGSLTLHWPEKDITFSFVNNDRSRQLQQTLFALDLFCYLDTIENITVPEPSMVRGSSNRSRSKLYPNPVKDKLNLVIEKTSGQVEVSIVDLAGKRMVNKMIELSGDNKIEMFIPQKIENGTYFINLSSSDFKEVIRVELAR